MEVMKEPVTLPREGSKTAEENLRDAEVRDMRITSAREQRNSQTLLEKVDLSPEEIRHREICKKLCPRALYSLSTENPIRKRVIKIVKSKLFDRTILGLILFNCLFLAMDSKAPDFKDSPTGKLSDAMEYVFTVAFVIEMLLKIVCLGFVVGKGTYLRDGWNAMDFTVVMLGLLPMIAGSILPSVSAVRTVRVLRPLRTVTGVEGMRKLVLTLLQSLPMLMDVCVLVSFMFLIFGIVGIIMFSGKLRNRCHIPLNTENVTAWAPTVDPLTGEPTVEYFAVDKDDITWELPDDEEDTVCAAPMYDDYPELSMFTYGHPCPLWEMDDGVMVQTFCRPKTGKIQNPNYDYTSYDHIGWAWLTIFQCITLEGWTDVMYYTQDGVSWWVMIFYVLMIVFVSFFAVNLMLAVLYVKFTEPSSAEDDEGYTPRTSVGTTEPPPTKIDDEVAVTSWQNSALKKYCYELQKKPAFEMTTMALIVLNTITMASEYHNMPNALSDALEWINYVLAAYFAGEMAVKLIGLGHRLYIRDRMNIFDGVVVVFSIVEIISNQISGGSGGSLSVLRTFRLMRVFKLARSWKQLNDIIRTIFKSLVHIAYLSLILLLFSFIFALLGMQLFGYQLEFCPDSEDAKPYCPAGEKCPNHRECYIECTREQTLENGGWTTWEDGTVGLCVQYPIDYNDGNFAPPASDDGFEYFAKLGQPYIPRHNFDNIGWSLITIFQILTGENWNSVMYDGMYAVDNGWASLYFVLLVVIGNYIILNLFLAILLDNFGGGSDEEDEYVDESVHNGMKQSQSKKSNKSNKKMTRQQSTASSVNSAAQSQAAGDSGVELEGVDESVHGGQKGAEEGSKDDKGASFPQSTSRGNLQTLTQGIYARDKKGRKKSIILEGNAMGFLKPDNIFRKKVAMIVNHKRFETVIIVLICLSSIILAIDSPKLGPESKLKEVLDILDKIFVVLFFIEFAMKVTVLGFVMGSSSYLRNMWNVLDFFIVLIGIVGWVGMGGGDLSALRALRTFRALRPIRVASRAEGMKVVVNALFQAIPGIANVVLVCFLFYLIFGILGLNLFMGKFYFCNDEDTGEPIDPVKLFDPMISPLDAVNYNTSYVVDITKELCQAGTITVNYPWPSRRENVTLTTKWKNPDDFNFDYIGAAIFTLFEMATLEGWLDVMYTGIDAVEVDQHPRRNNDPANAIFFVMFIVVGSFFVMNLFVGVTIDKFNEMKEKQEGRSVFLTEDQRSWVSIQKMMVSLKPKKTSVAPENEFRAMLYNVVVHERFDMFIMTMILMNVVVMSMQHEGMSESFENGLLWANNSFTFVFLGEAILKLGALYPKQYFRDAWNQFDFAVVTLSIFSLLVTVLANGVNIPGLNMLRIFRVARIFRLIPKAKGLRTLFQTLLVSLPALGNVGSVLVLFFFIFSVMGMNLFGKIKHQDFLDRQANYEDFPNAMLVLFRMSTGESWNGIMHDTMIKTGCWTITDPAHPNFGEWFDQDDDILNGLKEHPSEGKENRCSVDEYGIASLIYHMMFLVMCAFVMLNLVIAVILENFQKSTENEEATVSRDHFLRFQEVWASLDPNSTHYISAGKLTDVIAELDPPLGTRDLPHHMSTDIQNIIMSVDIPNHNGLVHFYETLHALAGRVAGMPLPEDEEVNIRNKIRDKLPTFSSEAQYPKYSAAHFHAALYVQAAVRGYLARYHMRMSNEEAARRVERGGHHHRTSDDHPKGRPLEANNNHGGGGGGGAPGDLPKLEPPKTPDGVQQRNDSPRLTLPHTPETTPAKPAMPLPPL